MSRKAPPNKLAPSKKIKQAPSQKVLRTATASFYTKTYLGVCRLAVQKANKIESAGKRTVIDIQLITHSGSTTYIITHIPKDPSKPKFSKITFHTERHSHAELSLAAKDLADRRYLLMQRGKHVFSTVYDMFYSGTRTAATVMAGSVMSPGMHGINHALGTLITPGLYAVCHVTIFFRR